MAAAAKISCYCCGETVAINLNKSMRAYYHCGHCGVNVQSKSSDSTDRMINKKAMVHPTPTQTPIPTSEQDRNTSATLAPHPTVPKRGGFATLLRTNT